MLLSNFEYWHNHKLDRQEQEISKARDDDDYRPDLSLWIYKSAGDLTEDLLGEYGRDNILKSVQVLIDSGFVITRADTKDHFSRTRFFQLVPDTVNQALRNLEIEAVKRDPGIESRKIDSRKSKFSSSKKTRPSTVGNQGFEGLKNDSLPYTEVTSSEGTSSETTSSSAQGSFDMTLTPGDEEDLDPVSMALAKYVVATPAEEKRIVDLARAADETLTVEEIAVAINLSIPGKTPVQHVNYFAAAVPKLISSRRWRMMADELRRETAKQAEFEEQELPVPPEPDAGQIAQHERWLAERCPFCAGTGTVGIQNDRSSCGVCRGSGKKLQVQQESRPA